jgi:hypothetical protein
MKKFLCLFLCLVGMLLMSCKKNPASPSTAGTISCTTSSAGTWNLYNALVLTNITYVSSNTNPNATFSVAPGTYCFTYSIGSNTPTQSPTFQVATGKTTHVTFYGDFTISGPS